MGSAPQIGVLAVQGAFAEHAAMLEALGAHPFFIRKAGDLDHPMDGLVLPGGESTAQGKLLRELGLFDTLHERIAAGLPTFGTCAGMILLARRLHDDGTVHLGLMDIEVRRNAYGRQLGSFITRERFGDLGEIPMTFIRAPYIESVGAGVTVLARVDGHIVAAREGNMLAISFHPEVTDDTSVHRYFLSMVEEHMAK